MEFITAFDLKTIVIILHLVGLAFGAGGAWISDLLILRFLQLDVITEDKVKIIHFMTKLVTFGLIILWLTGFGFLAMYYFGAADKLDNPKIWAKVTIVTILTFNGIWLHKFVMPLLKQSIGKTLFADVPKKTQRLMITTGTISLVSWIFPVLLGSSKALNFLLPMHEILAYYFVALVFTFLVLTFIMNKLTNSNEVRIALLAAFSGVKGALGDELTIVDNRTVHYRSVKLNVCSNSAITVNFGPFLKISPERAVSLVNHHLESYRHQVEKL